MKNFKRLFFVAGLMACLIPATASATTLEVGGATQNKAVSMELSLKSGTSAILKDNNGTTQDTCTGSTLKGSTEGSFTGSSVGGKVSTWNFTGCTHTTDFLTPGSFSITWTSGTNGSFVSSGAEWTTKSTVFGVSTVCKTGPGTSLGTITGVSSGNATLDINATTIDCGALGIMTWTGTYTITGPTGLGVVS